jgi:hypothetical protein
MALRKTEINQNEKEAEEPKTVEVISPGDRLRAMFDWLEEGAPGPDEDDGWDELQELLNIGRSEENKMVGRGK